MTRRPNELERYLDDFGSRLRAASSKPAIARRRRRLLAIGTTCVVAAAAAGLALIVVSGGGSSKRFDIVAEARAALSPPGEIVHMVIRSETARDDARPAPGNVIEQWSTVDPPRWRIIQKLPRPGEGRGMVADSEGPIYGRQEIAYANGVQQTFLAERNALLIQEGFRDDGPAARVPGFFATGGDPEVDLRAMLASGEVTDDGEHQVGGRAVRRLVSEHSEDVTARRRLVYDVDPDTFAPVQGSVTIRVGRGPRAPKLSLRFVVDRYVRIPITAESAKLLRIKTNSATKVTVRTAEDLRRRQERLRKWRNQCVSKPNGRVRCPAPPSEIAPIPPKPSTP